VDLLDSFGFHSIPLISGVGWQNHSPNQSKPQKDQSVSNINPKGDNLLYERGGYQRGFRKFIVLLKLELEK
jgi:hypothetical protein